MECVSGRTCWCRDPLPVHSRFGSAMLIFALLMPAAAGATMPLLALESYNISWALVIFPVILGLLVTLAASRRTSEIKRPKDD